MRFLRMSFMLFISLLYNELLSQGFDYDCIYPDPGQMIQQLAAVPTTGTTNMAIIICVERGQPRNFNISNFINPITQRIPDYFEHATFGFYHVNVTGILVKRTIPATGEVEAFELPGYLDDAPGTDSAFVARPSFVRNVLAQADTIYDFNNFDSNHDGIVDFVAFMVLRHTANKNGGTTGLSINSFYTTMDTLASGVHVRIDGNGYTSVSGRRAIIQKINTQDPERIVSLSAHELGHALFQFPDTDHLGQTDYGHNAHGSFCAMSAGGFNNVASLYNPIFRLNREWVTPTVITNNQTINFSDFDNTGLIYQYDIPNHAQGNVNQRFYITYYDKSGVNRWQTNWPLPSSGTNSRGLLIWHTSPNGNWSSRSRMPVDIEAAHGKWNWTVLEGELVPSPGDHRSIRSNVENLASGFDSLEVRDSYVWFRYDSTSGGRRYDTPMPIGQFYNWGSRSVFYDPLNPKEFAFYSNPSSNGYTTSGNNHNFIHGFKMSNLRLDVNTVRADVNLGNPILTRNLTLPSGTYYIVRDITVNPGFTLTLSAGTTLNFYDGTKLIIGGSLVANNVTFNFTSPNATTQNGIRFNSTSSGSLNGCTIRNAYRGIYCNVILPAIQSCIITSNTFGIFLNNTGIAPSNITFNTITANTSDGVYMYNSSPPNFRSNTITNNGRHGVYCYQGSSPYMFRNTISDNAFDGLKCEYNSSARLLADGVGIGQNRIFQNNTGIRATHHSNVYLNNTLTSVYGNTAWAIYASDTSNIAAEYTWWNRIPPTYPNYYRTGDFSINTTSTIDYIPALQSDPNVLNKIAAETNLSMSTESSFFDVELRDAMNKMLAKKYDEAILIYVKRYNNEKDIIKRKYVLSMIADCYRFAGRKGFIDYLNSDIRPKILKTDDIYASTLELENLFLLSDEKYDIVNSNLTTLSNAYSKNSSTAKNALFNLGYINYCLLDDEVKGKGYFSQLETRFPNDPLVIQSKLLTGEIDGSTGFPKSEEDNNKNENVSIIETQIPIDYKLLGNFPNPFNPSTIIKYSVPKESNVELMIYDMLGKEIKSYILNSQSAGYREIVWNGTDNYNQPVASGIYIYRIKAKSLEDFQVFEKSAKLILMK